MNISPNISDIIILITSAQCLFLSVFTYHKYGNTLPNKLLSIILILYAVIFFNLFLWEMQAYSGIEGLGFVLSGIAFLIPPSHYFYALFLSRSENHFHKKHLLHTIPFLIYISTVIVSSLFASENAMDVNNPDVFGIIINWAISVQGLIYTILIILVINKYSLNIRKLFSSLDTIKLGWLRNITILFSISFIVFIVENTLVSSSLIIKDKFDFSSMIAAIAVYFIGYIGLFKSEVFIDPEFTKQLDEFTGEEVTNLENSLKYSRSGLSEQKAEKKKQELLDLMKNEIPYTDSSLTLLKLAAMLGISSHNLSEIINTKLNQNFFDFINSYRIEKVKADLLNESKKNYTLLAIALDSGFNSKSAFNLVFKKFTGMTPTEYRKNIKI